MDKKTWIRSVFVFIAVVLTGILLLQYANDQVALGEGVAFESGLPVGYVFTTSDEPFQSDFPDQTKVHFDMPDSHGWQQSGEFPLEFDVSDELVKNLMKARSYTEKHRVSDPSMNPSTKRFLSQWELPNGRKKILWTLWRIDENRTGFSWGESK